MMHSPSAETSGYVLARDQTAVIGPYPLPELWEFLVWLGGDKVERALP
jgi:hypothetical protein